MAQDSFSFVPNDEVDDFVSGVPPVTRIIPPDQPLPEARSAQDILAQLPPPVHTLPDQLHFQGQPPPETPTPVSQGRTRVRIGTTHEQLAALTQLFHDSHDTLTIDELRIATRMSRSTISRLLQRLRRGEDITKKPKRGRRPKYSPALLKRLANDLCVKNKTLRGTQADLVHNRMDAVANEELPVVSTATIQRYVTDETLMVENDLVPLSFAQCTVRGPNANSEANKELRVQKRTEIDQYQRAGYTIVFVDESHWRVGNVRMRKWGEKGRKHIRTQPLTRFNLSCICAICDNGSKHCRLFNRTINSEMFIAYMRELFEFFSIGNTNVLFIMDNAPIHKNEIVQLAEENGHQVIFNAPYSPECNPIELVFGYWKTRVGQLVNVDIADMITNISKCFDEITPAEVKRSINHFMYEVTPKIFRREDL